MDKKRILILAGTTEARELAERLCLRPDLALTLSLAGRTLNPLPQPAPVRVGGFGGIAGLIAYLREQRFDLMIDATHPFANRISKNASIAAEQSGLPLLKVERPAWGRETGDRWTSVSSVQAAAEILGSEPRRVFLATGRQEAATFALAPQHHYVLRSIDPVDPPLNVPQVNYILARGPFSAEDEEDLFKALGIEVVVCKNSGGAATYGKLVAARRLGIEVVMVERDIHPASARVGSVAEAVLWIDQLLPPLKKRGV